MNTAPGSAFAAFLLSLVAMLVFGPLTDDIPTVLAFGVAMLVSFAVLLVRVGDGLLDALVPEPGSRRRR